MSEEPLTHKNQPPSAASDAEYDRIYDTLSETAQGRRFLEEYARRSRPRDAETSIAAIERMQAALRGDEGGGPIDVLLIETKEMAQAIARARAEIAAIGPSQAASQPEATDDLDAIAHAVESATARILATAERVHEIARTLRDIGVDQNFCDRLDALATEIATACSLQDLAGQRARKAIGLLRHLEERINGFAGSVAQPDVDAAMQPDSADDDRQDATLEDISRFMQALEPLVALHQAAAEAPFEPEADEAAQARVEDARPELSVAEAVMAEGDEARVMAEWAVEPAAPIQAKPAAEAEAAPMTEWIVEDPAAPKPESEPAWMILQRLQHEPEAEQEPEPESKLPESGMPPPPTTLLPLPELDFPKLRKPRDPLAELQAVLEAAELKLPQPGEANHVEAGATVSQPNLAAAPAEIPPAPPEPMEQPAAAAIDPTPPAPATAGAEVFSSASNSDADADEFLFAPGPPGDAVNPATSTPRDISGPADFLFASAAPSPAQPASAPMQWQKGSLPDPALVTPQVVSASAVAPPQAERERAPHDPLAPLRALSDEEKIALFS